MTYPLVQFVSAPALDADVRFDCNSDDLAWPDGDSFSIGAPGLIGDVGGVAPEYGYRTITFNLAVESDEAMALRTQVALARELQRDENWLMFQLSAYSAPVWFRCVRSSPGELSFATYYRDREKQRWIVSVALAADPFAMGEQEPTTLTIGNDPATGGLVAVLDDIKGDAPAPATFEITGLTSDSVAFGVAALSRWDGAQVWQESSFTGGTSGANTSASGGTASSLAPGDSFAPAFAAAVTPTQAGRWRLFARLSVSGTRTSTGEVVVRPGGTALADRSRPITLSSLGFSTVDLGVYAFPLGNMPVEAGYVLHAPFTNTVTIDAMQTGSGLTLALDYVVAVPVDLFEQRDGTYANLSNLSGDSIVVNGDRERVVTFGPGASNLISPTDNGFDPAKMVGAFPKVFPGATNVLHLLSTDSGVSESISLALKYQPRWLYLASS